VHEGRVAKDGVDAVHVAAALPVDAHAAPGKKALAAGEGEGDVAGVDDDAGWDAVSDDGGNPGE